MAFQAFLGAMNHVSRVVHSQRDRFFSMPPRSRCVRPQPARCRPVAVLTGYALRDFKPSSVLLRRGTQRVACQALWRFLRLRAQFQDPRHAFAHITGQRLVRPAMFVLDDPSRIFILQNPATRNGLNAAMTTRRRA